MIPAVEVAERIAGREKGLAPAPSRAGVLVEVDRHVLLVLARKHGSSPIGNWSIPKGRVDSGETPWGAALRELREECGLDLSDSAFLPEGIGRLNYLRKGKPVTMEVLHYRLSPADLSHLLTEGLRLRHSCDEVAEARLMDLSEASGLISPAQAPLLGQVFAHLPAPSNLPRYPLAG